MLNLAKRMWSWAVNHQPAWLFGAMATAATTAEDLLVNQHLSWRDALPLVAAAVIRRFVYPPAHVVVQAKNGGVVENGPAFVAGRDDR